MDMIWRTFLPANACPFYLVLNQSVQIHYEEYIQQYLSLWVDWHIFWPVIFVITNTEIVVWQKEGPLVPTLRPPSSSRVQSIMAVCLFSFYRLMEFEIYPWLQGLSEEHKCEIPVIYIDIWGCMEVVLGERHKACWILYNVILFFSSVT